MTYIDHFVAALQFYFELNPSEKSGPDFDRLRQSFLQNQLPPVAPAFRNTKRFAAHLADEIVRTFPGDLAHSCHAASSGFLQSWYASQPPEIIGTFAITIGSVRFQGHPVFEATRSSVAEVINCGHQPNTTLPVHVWLTLDDLTVLDLTIVSTLIASGDLPANASRILFWREDQPSEFSFEPILVDNLFFERVDSGEYSWK